MSAFKANYTPLDSADPALGRCAVLPWDSDYFGFNVGSYIPGDPAGPPARRDRLAPALRGWMGRNQVELLSCSVPGDANRWLGWLGTEGFAFVDLSLLAFARRLTALPPARVTVRLADDADLAALVDLAGRAFTFGRYHVDARFPRALADERYRHWMRNAMAARSETELVLVSGPSGAPTGFIHAVLRADVADLRLAAVDPGHNHGFLGAGLFVSALRMLVDRGARRAQARLSTANIPILNLYSSLGFSFHEAEAVYHLHADPAPHLVALT